MTDRDLAARAAALAARSGSRPSGRRRRHPAAVSRIVTAGLSGTALFGLIAALTLSTPAPTVAQARPAAPATRPVSATRSSSPTPVAVPAATPAPAPAAAPVTNVRTATSADAPSGRPVPVTRTKTS